MATKLLIASFLSVLAISSKDYSNCRWFGNTTNAPLSPIDVCTAHSHETELDNLWLYSTKLQCNNVGELTQFEWNNTNCNGDAYNNKTYRKEDGYYFHCDAPTSCPFTKLILRDLRDIGNTTTNTHNGHLCVFDNNAYHEVALVTNICIDFIEEYNISFYVDCDANTYRYTAYNDTECKTRRAGRSYFELKEGCEDEFGFNAYIQIAECDDANYRPIQSTATTKDNQSSGSTSSSTHKSGDQSSGSTSSSTHKSDDHPVHSTSSRQDNHSAIIFCLIVALVIMGLVIAIILTLVKRKSEREINKANIDDQPFNVDFQSIGDGDDVEPGVTQHITTQGQDIKEIPIIAAPDMIDID